MKQTNFPFLVASLSGASLRIKLILAISSARSHTGFDLVMQSVS